MISRLDRYVARTFLSSWLVSAVFFIGLFGVLKFFGNLGNLIERGLGDDMLGNLGLYYLYQLPTIVITVAPFVMLMAALFTVTRLQRHNEFMAMLLTGRSSRRVVGPIVVLSVVFIAGLIWVQEVAAPATAVAKLELEANLNSSDGALVLDEVKALDSDGRLFVATGYHVEEERIERLYVSYADGVGRQINIEGTDAIHDADAGGWRVRDGVSEVHNPDEREPEAEDVAFVPTDLQPEDLLVGYLQEFELSYQEILERAERYPNKNMYRLRKHYHFTYPLSIFLLVLLGLPFVLRTQSSSRWMGPAISFGICVVFMLVDVNLRMLGRDGVISPVLAAWLPVVVAGSLAFVLMDAVES